MSRLMMVATAVAALVLGACSNEARDVFAPNQEALTQKIESGQFSGEELATLYLQRGYFSLVIGEPAQAIADCNQALVASPDFVAAYRMRAEAYRQAGRLNEAMADADRAVALSPPTDAQTYLLRASLHENRDDYAKAVADYDEALARDPANWVALVNRGVALSATGDLGRARADLDQAIKTDPGMINKSPFRTCTRFQAQTTANCRTSEIGMSTSTLMQRAYFSRGVVLLRTGNYQFAVTDLRRVENLGEAKVYWGLAELGLGNCHDGFTRIRRAHGYDSAAFEKVLAEHRDFIAKTDCAGGP